MILHGNPATPSIVSRALFLLEDVHTRAAHLVRGDTLASAPIEPPGCSIAPGGPVSAEPWSGEASAVVANEPIGFAALVTAVAAVALQAWPVMQILKGRDHAACYPVRSRVETDAALVHPLGRRLDGPADRLPHWGIRRRGGSIDPCSTFWDQRHRCWGAGFGLARGLVFAPPTPTLEPALSSPHRPQAIGGVGASAP